MLPRLFHIGSFSQSTYGVLVALAFLAALSLIARLARRAGLNSDRVVNLGILCGISAIIGAKIMMFLVDIPYYCAIRAKSSPWPACRPAEYSMAA